MGKKTETATNTSIISLTKDRIDEAIALLVHSFHNEPNFADIFPNQYARSSALPHVFASGCREALNYGCLYGALSDEELSGVALWLPSDVLFSTSIRRQLCIVPDIFRLAISAPGSLRRFGQYAAGVASHYPSQPFWNLSAVGVKPTMRRRGIGTQLLGPILTRADETGTICYLETSTKQNVEWYRKLGFNVQENGVSFAPGGPLNWTMIRQPK